MTIPNAKPDLVPCDLQAVQHVLESRQIAEGPDIERFEAAFAKRISVAGAVAVSNGFAALHLGLLAMDVQPGDEVILPCLSTCPAMRNAVMAVGATPVYADTNHDDFNVSVDSVREKISGRTRAVIAPHHTGVAANIPALVALGLPVLEDAAQALGARWEGRPVGSLGSLGVFSFYATKIMTTIDGGMITGNYPEMLSRAREGRYYRDRWDQQLRFNYKMQNLHAALGCVQLERLDDILKRRSEIASRYLDVFEANGYSRQNVLHGKDGDVYFRWAVRMPAARKQALVLALAEKGLPYRADEMHWLGVAAASDFPHATRLIAETITFPVYPALTEDEVNRMMDGIDEALSKTT